MKNFIFFLGNYLNTDPLISYFIEMVLDKFDLLNATGQNDIKERLYNICLTRRNKKSENHFTQTHKRIL